MGIRDDVHWMRETYRFAKKYSDDPRTNTGASIVSQKGILLSFGANEIPEDLDKIPEMLEKENKANYINHAERKSFASCAKYGKSTNGAIMYTPWEPCSGCGLMIIDSGISELVLHKELNDFSRKNTDSFWIKEQDITLKNMIDAGINVRYLEGKLFSSQENFFINFRGSQFFP